MNLEMSQIGIIFISVFFYMNSFIVDSLLSFGKKRIGRLDKREFLFGEGRTGEEGGDWNGWWS